nr:hypothetical protein [uncultured Undibacterium sp.]
MSTGKIDVTTSAEVTRAALIAQQEAERAARLKRLQGANSRVSSGHARYSALQGLLHTGQCQYPADLSFTMPSLHLPSVAGDDPFAMEQYADMLDAQLRRIGCSLDHALAAAKAAHDDRIACQRTWHDIHAHGDVLHLVKEELVRVAGMLGESLTVEIPPLPIAEADLSTLQAHLQKQKLLVKNAKIQLGTLQQRFDDRTRAHAQTGARIIVKSGIQALSAYHTAQVDAERQAARQHIDACLLELGWSIEDIPEPIAQQIGQVESCANAERIAGLLRQCKARRQGQKKAQQLMLQPPPHFDPPLQKAWASFADKLQAAVNGNISWDDSFHYEHQSIQKRASELMQAEYQMSCIRQRAAEAGFDVVESEGMVTVNLQGLASGYGYEVRHLGQKGKQAATHFQLVAGAGMSASSDVVAANAGCKQLKSILPGGGNLIEADDLLDQCVTSTVGQTAQGGTNVYEEPARKKRRVSIAKKKFFAMGG